MHRKDEKNTVARTLTYALMGLFCAVSIGLIVYCAVTGQYSFMLRGLLFPLFLCIPWVFQKLGLRPCWRLYALLYAFVLFAYSFGCVYGAFTKMEVMDKVSHFFSGTLFTIVGICGYYLLRGDAARGAGHRWGLAASYGLFFSSFIALAWEVCEYFDFALTGNDSQNHLTTGVFDTMHDLMACLAASVLSVAAFALWRKTRLKLLTPAVVEEFYEKNVAGKNAEKSPKNTK